MTELYHDVDVLSSILEDLLKNRTQSALQRVQSLLKEKGAEIKKYEEWMEQCD